MAENYVTSAFLQAQNSQLYAVFGWSQREKQIILSKSWLTILEIFVHEHSLEKAYRIYQNHQGSAISQQVILEVDKYKKVFRNSDNFVVSLVNENLSVFGNGFKSVVDKDIVIELTQLSEETY